MNLNQEYNDFDDNYIDLGQGILDMLSKIHNGVKTVK